MPFNARIKGAPPVFSGASVMVVVKGVMDSLGNHGGCLPIHPLWFILCHFEPSPQRRKKVCGGGGVQELIHRHMKKRVSLKSTTSTGWCSTPNQLLICSSFSKKNGNPLLICSSLSTNQSIIKSVRLCNPHFWTSIFCCGNSQILGNLTWVIVSHNFAPPIRFKIRNHPLFSGPPDS